jgi:hypothetical protein
MFTFLPENDLGDTVLLRIMIILKNFILLSIVVVLSSITSTVYAQENAAASEEPKFLALQHAQSGAISEINASTYTLELNEVSDKTILFSDRPDRIVTSISTSNFVGNWTEGKDSFAEDAPNAVLVVDESEEQDTVVIELFNPVYDAKKNTLKYDVTPDNTTFIELPIEFGRSTLVIDWLHDTMQY